MPTLFSISYLVGGAWSAATLFSDAQIVSATRTLVNQGTDTCQLVFAGTQPPGAGSFAYRSMVRIWRDDFDGPQTAGNPTGSNPRGWFTGLVIGPKKATMGNSESCTVTLSGPWWFLANIVYQQLGLYYVPTGTIGTNDVVVNTVNGPLIYFGKVAVEFNPYPVQELASDIILTQNQQDGVPMDGGQTLNDALAWAIKKGAYLQVGSLPPDQVIPSEAATDPTCADVIKKVLRWLPTTVSWFDYTTDPPSLNFADRTTRPAQTLQMGGATPQVQTATLQPRPDLVLPGVTLYYLRQLTVNQQISSTQTTLAADGTSTSTTTEPTPGTTTPTSGGFQINGGYISTSSTTQGTVPGSGGGVTTTTTSESLQINVLQKDTAGPDPDGIGAMVCTIQLQGGNVQAASPTPTAAFEPTPTGLAATIYNSRQLLSYEGQIVVKGQDLVNLGNPLGSVVNIAGGEPEWATMLAEVQTCSENTATGATTLGVGAPTHLGASDLAALLQANRLRNYVSLGDSLARNTGGAAIPPTGPLTPPPPSAPPKGGGGGGTGNSGGGDPDATPTGQTGAGILDLYSGTQVGLANSYLGAAYPNGFGGNVQNPGPQTYLQEPPGSGGATLQGSGGGGLNFFHTIGGSMTVDGAEGFPDPPNPAGVAYVGSSSCSESYSQGTLDLTGFSALQYSYAELRGQHVYSNADGTTTTEAWNYPVTGYLGLITPGFRVYVPGQAQDHDAVGQPVGGATRSKSESLTMSGLYVIPR